MEKKQTANDGVGAVGGGGGDYDDAYVLSHDLANAAVLPSRKKQKEKGKKSKRKLQEAHAKKPLTKKKRRELEQVVKKKEKRSMASCFT